MQNWRARLQTKRARTGRSVRPQHEVQARPSAGVETDKPQDPELCLGVVGRTRSGKSTLMVALLRISEMDSGRISIDWVDVRSLGLKRIISEISIIPQDPMLFSGTVRSNLDLFQGHQYDTLLGILLRVGLMSGNNAPEKERKEKTGGSGTGAIASLLDSVLEGGSDFSVGQQQLLVIARALLCQRRVVIVEKFMAAVDYETDARVHRILRTEFRGATVITVAHRLSTIMDSDYVLVMDDGRVAEYGSPASLLSLGGLFKDLYDTFERETKRNRGQDAVQGSTSRAFP